MSLLYILSILLLCTSTIHSNVEHERRDMVQRASAALEEILNTEEFEVQEPGPSWWSRYLERFLEHLPEELGWMGNVLRWLFYMIVILITLSVFIVIAKRLRRSFALPGKIGHDIPAEPQRLMEPETAARMEAHEWSQKGNYRQAIRCLFLSLLMYLDRAGLLTYDMSKTNGEYLNEVRSAIGNKAESFAFLTLLFERKWYGMEDSGAVDFRQYEDAFDRLIGSIVSSQ